jgi:hypothetical protein
MPSTTAYGVAVAAVVLLLARLSLVPIRSDDIFFYLALGRRLFADGGLPPTDPYLFTLHGYRWEVWHEWGSFALAYLVHAAAGWAGLIAGKTILIVGAYSLPLLLARVYGKRRAIVPVVVAVAAFAGAPRFIERSSLFSDVLGTAVLAFVLIAAEVGDRAWRRPWPALIVGTFAIWANLHPGFLAGLVILAVHAAARLVSRQPVKRELLLLGGAALACLVNPQGPRVFAYPLRPLLDPSWAAFRASNFEWRSTLEPSNLGLTSTRALLALVAVAVALLATSLARKRLRVHEHDAAFTLLAGAWFTYLGLSAVRFVLPASLGLALIVTVLARRAGALDAVRGQWAGALPFAAAVVYVVLQRETPGDHLPLPVPGAATALDESVLPVRAAEVVDGLDPDLRIFNQHEFGSYLIWRWDGRRKVYYHGFVTDLGFYQEDYIAVNRSAADFTRIVEKYDVGAFLLATYPASRTKGPRLYRTLLSSPDWRLAYHDEAAMLFVKKTP